MDPTRSTRPKNWRTFGRIALFLLIAAALTAAGGWLTSIRGQDPTGIYRLAVMFGSGALFLGLIWAGSAAENRME